MPLVDAIAKPTAGYVARNEETIGQNNLAICVVTNLVVFEIILYDQTFANEVVWFAAEIASVARIASWGWRATWW